MEEEILVLLSRQGALSSSEIHAAVDPGRLVSNALLIAAEHRPLSFRTVDSVEYKKGDAGVL